MKRGVPRSARRCWIPRRSQKSKQSSGRSESSCTPRSRRCPPGSPSLSGCIVRKGSAFPLSGTGLTFHLAPPRPIFTGLEKKCVQHSPTLLRKKDEFFLFTRHANDAKERHGSVG